MLFPVRCYSCRKVTGNWLNKYNELCLSMSRDKALDKIGIRRPCCRNIFLNYVPLFEKRLLVVQREQELRRKAEATASKRLT